MSPEWKGWGCEVWVAADHRMSAVHFQRNGERKMLKLTLMGVSTDRNGLVSIWEVINRFLCFAGKYHTVEEIRSKFLVFC